MAHEWPWFRCRDPPAVLLSLSGFAAVTLRLTHSEELKVEVDRPNILSLVLALTALVVAPYHTAVASQHPERITLGNTDAQWVSGEVLLNPDGSVHESVDDSFRRNLEWQFGWDEYDGVRQEGYTHETGPHCPPFPVETLRPSELHSEDFSTLLLLADTTVRATVSEIVPGYGMGGPALLLVLSDVTPLRPGSPTPSYAIMPVGQYVIAGRLLCHTRGRPFHNELPPQEGTPIVLMGRTYHGTVALGRSPWIGAIGVPDRKHDDEPLIWQFMAYDAPLTVSGVRDRISEALAGGLFDLAAPLAALPPYAPERQEFSELWADYHYDDCRVAAVQLLGDGSLALTHRCSELEHRHQIEIPRLLQARLLQ